MTRGTKASRAAAARLFMLLAVFMLAAANAFAWSFAVCGDSRDDSHGVFSRILEAVERADMEFLVHTGDLEGKGGRASWEAFRRRTRAFGKPIHVVVGNHELHGSSAAEFARFFGLPGPSYAFRHKDAYFAIVDNAGGALTDGTLSWLDRELSAHPLGKDGVDHLVIAMHIPPRTDNIFPHGTARKYGEQSARLLEILKRHRAEIVLASHEHMHSVDDWDGIKVIVSGGAGAPMFPLQSFGFYRIDVSKGGTRETFIPIAKKPPPR